MTAPTAPDTALTAVTDQEIPDDIRDAMNAIFLNDLPRLPNNPNGRKLVAQTAFWNAVQMVAGLLDNKEATGEAKRVGRALGFVERDVRGPRSKSDDAITTPASPTAPTSAQSGNSNISELPAPKAADRLPDAAVKTPQPAPKPNGK